MCQVLVEWCDPEPWTLLLSAMGLPSDGCHQPKKLEPARSRSPEAVPETGAGNVTLAFLLHVQKLLLGQPQGLL